MHYEYDVDSRVVRSIIQAASNAKDYRDYALSSVLFALLALAYNQGKVDLVVVYESANGTRPTIPADFSARNLQTTYGGDLLVLYSADDHLRKKGLNIPVHHLSPRTLKDLLVLANIRERLVHKRKDKSLEVSPAKTVRKKGEKKGKEKQQKPPASGENTKVTELASVAQIADKPNKEDKRSSPSSLVKKKTKRSFIPYDSIYDLNELVSVAQVFRAYCQEVRINEILAFDGAPHGKIRAITRYAEHLGFRTQTAPLTY